MATEVTENTFMGANSAVIGGKLMLVLGIAGIIAFMTVVWLWSQKPDYRVLFANFSDKDGGAIVAQLEQMNVPFKFSDGGTAILVPSEQVHEARLKLAAQGLPKGGNVGFELLENQKFGVSQFVEQVNFQRALEGELERSIQSVDSVQGARVHLAIPKSSVFVRDQLKPTASVILNIHAGRTLDPRQVSAIVHLVASSVPELPSENVTLVDQNGNLLSDTSKQDGANQIDPTKIKYIEDMQSNIAKRVESIIAPLVGPNNVRAEASADIDFSTVEQANESYKPNQKPDETTIRSMQTSESQSTSSTTGGVPGALSNQPPAPATAPITSNNAAGAGAAAAGTPSNSQKNVTTNFEVDKTVRYVQQPMGNIKRLAVAVVVNNKTVFDKKGKASSRPLNEAEKKQIIDLAKQAMGFNADRGDTISVVNSSFVEPEAQVVAPLPLWKDPANIELAKEIGKFLAGIIIIMMLYNRMLKPMMKSLTAPPALPVLNAENPAQITNADGTVTQVSEGEAAGNNNAQTGQSYQQNLEITKQIARENPKLVANVVTSWVSQS